MKISRLEIQMLPGIEPGFTLDGITPGINLITGPNAVGKSSLIRALGYLIGEPQGDDPQALALKAVFEGDSGRWAVRRTGREVVWERDGRTSTRPALPERDQLHCYWLSMEDLLTADQRDERLVSELRRAMSGGYDLHALRRESPFELRPRSGRSEARQLHEAEKLQRQVEADYDALQREAVEIPTIEARIEDARAAGAQARSLEQALALLAVSGERKPIEAGLAEFPDNMERFRGDEFQRLQRLESKRGTLRSEIDAQVQARDNARLRLEETNLVSARPGRVDLDTCNRNLETAWRRSDQREKEQQRLEQVEAVKRQALLALGGREDLPRLDPDSVSEAENLARDIQTAERRHQELEDRLQEASGAPDEVDLDRHTGAAAALRAWLAAEGTIRRLLWITSFTTAGALLACVAAFLATAWLALLGGVVALGASVWALLTLLNGGRVSSRREFDESGLEPPQLWQRKDVEICLREIENRRIELLRQIDHARQAENLRGRIEHAKQELESLKHRKIALADRLGFDPTLTAAGLDRFVRLVQDFTRTHGEYEAARVAIERLDAEIGALIVRINSCLAQWQATPADKSLDALDLSLTALRGRVEQAETAERELQEAVREEQRLRNAMDVLGDDEAALFREVGLEPGHRVELENCIRQFDAWRQQRERLRNVRVREAERRAALEGEDALLQRVEAVDRAGLETDLAQAIEKAEELEALQAKLTTIRTRLSTAGHDRRLELAMSAVDSAQTSLEERCHETCLAEAAHLLLDGVEKEYRSEHEPDVLRYARDRFRRFTHHSFDLELDENEGFFARDLQQQARRSLPELSSATRMQLLLAMRLAWTRRLEDGRESLPLFLDEALTTSDEHRFTQVAESLEQLAKEEGRQIFYLSARRHELSLWERTTGSQPHHIDLTRVRFGRPDVEPSEFVLPDADPLPAPEEGQSPENYAAALGVLPVTPFQLVGTLHLFHLLRDDLILLHHLMENWRVETLGQLESLLGSSAAAAAIAAQDWRRRLQGRCATIRAWFAAWRQGRGKLVDRIALESSHAVSDKFLDRVAELAESEHGDGIALILALRSGGAPRFRTSNIDELERWLYREGYIDTEDPLNRDDRERRTLQDVAGLAEPHDIREIVRCLEASLVQDQAPDVIN